MKYDSKKCNNLDFKLDSGVTGFVKVAPNGLIYLYQYGKIWSKRTMGLEYDFLSEFDAKEFDEFVESHELSIVPRNPETYTDWKVGDGVINKTTGDYNIITAMLGNVVFLLNGRAKVSTISTIALNGLYKLVLTDYEKELLKAQELEEKRKECPFKNGDRVLVRDNDDAPWQHDIFYFYEEESSHPYCCQIGQVQQCIPLNEHTWQLLGTTDEYKEEE